MKRLFLVLLFTLAACSENKRPATRETITDAPAPGTATAPSTQTTAPPPATATEAEIPAVKGPKLLPVDEAKSDPSLVAYRADLLEEVRSRNVEAVVARIDPNIRTTFGAGGGVKDFRKLLGQPRVWESLQRAIELGGKFVGEGETRAFWTPYVYSAWPDRHDAFESLVVIGENVPLREIPDENGRVVATLSHDIVARAEMSGDLSQPFIQVKTADGRSGFVASSSVWSPVGYRAGFVKRDGEWKMNAFVAGD